MEEVDKIIIESLNYLNCNIDADTVSLKNFGPDLVVEAISTCLQSINPQLKLSRRLPTSMSAKIKFASNLAQHIKDHGFRGDMGYQSILYCNEVEIRRVLMFLIERLPKESSPASIEPLGYVSRIVKKIEDSLKQSLSKMWLPSEALNFGTREIFDEVMINSLANSCPAESIPIIVSDETIHFEERSFIPYITKQCTSQQLIPSLLFQDLDFNNTQKLKKIASERVLQSDESTGLLNLSSSSFDKVVGELSNRSQTPEIVARQIENQHEDNKKVNILFIQLTENKNYFISLQESIQDYMKNISKIISERTEKQELLKDLVINVKVKNKTLAVLTNDENKAKLRKNIQKAESRLIDLAKQWKEVESPLLEEYRTLRSSVSLEGVKYQDEQYKLQKLKTIHKDMIEHLKDKNVLEQTLMERCKALDNKNTRAEYTRRILEIVRNIKNQHNEIRKVLSDTREIQKDIKNLTGQVDRSFTLCDEIIFFSCKHDEAARKAYKYLAALREECNIIIQAVADIGKTERELRHLEEQIEIEKNKDMNIKLEKIQHDLTEIRKESQLLMC